MDSSSTERTISPHNETRATSGSARRTFHFDFVDPCSYVLSHLIDRAGANSAFEWRGFELHPPPLSMADPLSAAWQARTAEAHALARRRGVDLADPELLPWTRKAHELCEFARERDCFHRVRRRVFRAHFVDRVDIGRIDSLVEVAHRAGLDRTEAKAALDVDHYTGTVVRDRTAALERGVGDVPTVAAGGSRLVGSGSLREIEQLLAGWIDNDE